MAISMPGRKAMHVGPMYALSVNELPPEKLAIFVDDFKWYEKTGLERMR